MEFAMRALMLAFCFCLMMSSSLQAARIDATKGRDYPISRDHGPWMIMVASLSEPPEQRRKEGITPDSAAAELVYALRKIGIPAYAYRRGEVQEEIQAASRTGRTAKAHFRAQKESVCVLAGNYKGIEDTVAQKTLAYIKGLTFEKLNLQSWEQDGVFRATPGQPGPFSGAFLAVNPLLSLEEIAARRKDPLLLKLNAGGDNSIMENKGKYTLVVASFKGRHQAQVGESGYRQALDSFQISGTLDNAAERAWKVARILRDGPQEGTQKGRRFEAFVFHDRYQSVVTIGSFSSPQDPAIQQIRQLFEAKVHRGTNGKSFTTGESLMVPGNPPETVVFDPVPRLMEVPKLK